MWLSIFSLPGGRALLTGFSLNSLGFIAFLWARWSSSERGVSSDTVFSLCAVKSDVIQNRPLFASLCEGTCHDLLQP
ncbi:hypothetical protein D9M72_594290 [compost metagenome]